MLQTEEDKLYTYYLKIENDLQNNLLPFWMRHSLDGLNGGFYGEISNQGNGNAKANKLIVSHTRILWNYSHAFTKYKNIDYLHLANYAFKYIMNYFWDHTNGGAYWQLDYAHHVTNSNKRVYGQAFTIYAFAEYFEATGNKIALEKAIELFKLLDIHALDHTYGGYNEGFAANWTPTHDPLTGAKGPQEKKSMNTTIHLMEAFTNLIRVSNNERVKNAQLHLIDILVDKIIDPKTNQQKIFFDEKWATTKDIVSYGHDIETSWLLCEAAQVLDDKVLIKKTNELAIKMVDATLATGVDKDGALFYEGNSKAVHNNQKMWWPQAEALVGLLNAWQISGNSGYLEAFYKLWDFIERYLIDHKHGEWFLNLSKDGKPNSKYPKGNGWKSPYHNTRACFESLHRIGIALENSPDFAAKE